MGAVVAVVVVVRGRSVSLFSTTPTMCATSPPPRRRRRPSWRAPPDRRPLAYPWSSQIDGEFRELRCHFGGDHYRILYRRSGNLFLLLHILRKNTGRLGRADIVVAQRRWEDFKQRMLIR